MKKSIYGKKIGMTQLMDDNSNIIPVTVVQVYECPILLKKSTENHGYNALVVAFSPISENKLNKPINGIYKKLKHKPMKYMREIRCDNIDDFNDIESLTINQFEVGDVVSCTSKSSGKGFQGTIKRHGFSRGPMSHGSKNHRLPGSIGAGTDPARVFKGTRMGGKMGNSRVTISGLHIVQINLDNDCIFIKGSIPGKNNTRVLIQN